MVGLVSVAFCLVLLASPDPSTSLTFLIFFGLPQFQGSRVWRRFGVLRRFRVLGLANPRLGFGDDLGF